MSAWAADYVGTPFGDGPGELTCWGLVRRVLADQRGVDLPSYGEISHRDLLRVARAIGAGQDGDDWLPVGQPSALDVCVMRLPTSSRIGHVGVMVDSLRVLHTQEGTGAAIVPVRHFSIAARIAGYRRHKDLAT